MASSIAASKIVSHARSISLPSRSHPITSTVEESLDRLRATEATSSSLSSISHKVNLLGELYENLSDMLQLPLTQHFLHTQNAKWAEKVLDGSVQILDVCSATKDVLSVMKESFQELESSFRRRKAGDRGLDSEVERFRSSRKNVTKLVQKYLINLKKNKKNLFVEDHGHPSLVNMLSEAEAASLSLFECLLLAVSGSKTESKSLVSKLLRSKRIACEVEELCTSELEKLDSALEALKRDKSSKTSDFVQNVQKQLETFELRVQDLDEGIENLFRHLMRIRVSLLNILNHY
ncbi:Protein BPS1, chloroplastic [Dillenia turbinata]|uniref:Protein BPS1, chloroplastic n=1 Tax=Dillenia turbinata TaxID=194707 RepID=A0AAN8VRU0_9MAGN